jgi:hypothetical protein
MPSTTDWLLLGFGGWATIRLPTDPDPSDEPRGTSGSTFAFGDEPDLDRIIRFQPQRDPSRLRDGADWDWGVRVDQAVRLHVDGTTTDVAVVGAPVDLLGSPVMENRNWLLSLPGYETIIPLDLVVELGDGPLRRSAPLTKKPVPTYKLTQAELTKQAAGGVTLEPETAGALTGIWDAVALLRRRRVAVQALLDVARDDAAIARYTGRLAELDVALANPFTMRVLSHYGVQRYRISLDGPGAQVPMAGPAAGLDAVTPWTVALLFTCFDPDTFGMFAQGYLRVPFTASA